VSARSEGAPGGERIQKVLARAGLGSRRVTDALVAAGRVQVNGERAAPGRRVDPAVDDVRVDGVPIGVAPGLVYYLLQKPAGVVTSAERQDDRPVVVELVPRDPRVFPVGRLDADTEGLLVLTNDGRLAQRLAHPSFGVEKEYLAEVAGEVTPGVLRRLREGVLLDDGPASVLRVACPAPHLLRLVVHEGRHHLVRRLCAAVGHPVRRLVRVRIGPLQDPRLPLGSWRPLSPAEVRALERAAAGRPRSSDRRLSSARSASR
jgi:23S rRNA pseudouridine2605 synthase